MKPLNAWQSMAVLRKPTLPTRPLPEKKRPPSSRREALLWQGASWMALAIGTLMALAIIIAVICAINFPFWAAYKSQNLIHRIDAKGLESSLAAVRNNPDANRHLKTLIKEQEDRVKQMVKQPTSGLAAQLADLDQSKSAGHLVGHTLIVHAAPREIAEQAKIALEKQGAKVVPARTCLKKCAVLHWTPPFGWSLYGRGTPDENKALEAWIALSLAHTGPPAALIKTKALAIPMTTVAQGTQAVLNEALTSALHFGFFLVAWVMALGSGILGYQWDVERSKGRLEPWVMTHHSPWVMYGSQIRNIVTWAAGGFGVLLLLAALWQLPVRWSFLLALWLCLPPAIVTVSLWSLFATVLFHHANGRMFARIALSPVTLGIAWTFRAMVMLGAMKLAQPLQARALLDTLSHSGATLVLISVGLWGLAGLLAWLVHWRIGPRREGLRQTL